MERSMMWAILGFYVLIGVLAWGSTQNCETCLKHHAVRDCQKICK